MDEKFTPSQPIGRSDGPDSPLLDEQPSDETNTAADATCTFEGQTYNKGATICINKEQFQCGNSGWFKNGKKC
jgi:hypothetical protein